MVNKKALSLVEVLVSVMILALIMGGMANVFMTGKRFIFHSRARMAGGELGKFFLDPLQMDVRGDTWGNNCLSAATGCPLAQTLSGIIYTPVYEFSNVAGTSLRRVKVTISWPMRE